MQRFLKTLSFISCTILLLSASCRNVTDENNVETSGSNENGFIEAVVTQSFSEEGCEYLIAPTQNGELMNDENGNVILYMPIELDEAFRKNGPVEIKFHLSRIKQEGCFHAKPIIIDEIREGKMTNPGMQMISGTVHLTDDACKIYIDAEIAPDEIKRFYPVNLDEKFRKEGMKIKFSYNLSRAMQPEGCYVDHVVSINAAEKNSK